MEPELWKEEKKSESLYYLSFHDQSLLSCKISERSKFTIAWTYSLLNWPLIKSVPIQNQSPLNARALANVMTNLSLTLIKHSLINILWEWFYTLKIFFQEMEDVLKLKEMLLRNSWSHMQNYWWRCGRNTSGHYLKKKENPQG